MKVRFLEGGIIKGLGLVTAGQVRDLEPDVAGSLVALGKAEVYRTQKSKPAADEPAGGKE